MLADRDGADFPNAELRNRIRLDTSATVYRNDAGICSFRNAYKK